MKLLNIMKRFQKDEDGAVTVDWVVLTAAVVGLGIIVLAAIKPAITTLSGSIATEIGKADDGFSSSTGGTGGTGGTTNP
ncbi:Flp family type IVb pilin [Pseudogemmobacter blasticus]|uniref:Pilus assembly protein n=1 Tax=Fuscovulum blasticum DSM 2131 TaxID=1188250 RepID=A0A2T4J4C1_FUSBL|nr:pilus assembly protein [Fuscovulum blasticum]PTE12707.1 pilus assembly protein [Fuscovulum blasticum DSM 2131]